MRIDKFLKVSRLIKRRTIAKDACDNGKILINDKVAKAGSEIVIGDIITIIFGDKKTKYEIIKIADTVKKDDAMSLYNKL